MAKEKLYVWDYGPAHIAGEGDGETKLTIEDCVNRYVKELDPIIDSMHESCGDISVSDMATMFYLFFKMKRLMWDINKDKKYGAVVKQDQMNYEDFVGKYEDNN